MFYLFHAWTSALGRINVCCGWGQYRYSDVFVLGWKFQPSTKWFDNVWWFVIKVSSTYGAHVELYQSIRCITPWNFCCRFQKRNQTAEFNETFETLTAHCCVYVKHIWMHEGELGHGQRGEPNGNHHQFIFGHLALVLLVRRIARWSFTHTESEV